MFLICSCLNYALFALFVECVISRVINIIRDLASASVGKLLNMLAIFETTVIIVELVKKN